jgi:uncharacterized repeat protein (TIGR04076 family)
MAKRYDVKITLIEQHQKCPNGHKAGESWTVGRLTPAGLCMGAFATLLPYITTLRFGGNFPWETQEGTGTFACPDHLARSVFVLERQEPKS